MDIEPIHTLLFFHSARNEAFRDENPLILSDLMIPAHCQVIYQFVIDPSGLRNKGIGA